MAEKVEGAAVGSVGLSVLAVALITVVWPLVMGGSVALAVSFAGEVAAKETPDDFNGFQWLETGRCTPSTSTWTTVSTNPFGEGKNWTNLNAPYDSANGFNSVCNNNRSHAFEIRIPHGVVDVNESLSRFVYEYRSTGFCTASCSGQWFFDYALKVNGTVVFEKDDQQTNAIYERTTTALHWRMGFNHELNGIELLTLRSELGDCGDSCVVSVVFSDIREGDHEGYDYQDQTEPFKGGKHRVETFTTDAEIEGLIMTLSPWVVSILTFGVAIGSTRFWNPLVGVLSR